MSYQVGNQMVKWSSDSIDNYLKLDNSPPTFAKQWFLIYFLFFSTILSLTFPTFSPAEEKPVCNASECNYTVQFDHPGFYIAVVTLPPNQREGVWSLIIDPPTAHRGSFHGGGVLQENGTVPSWVAFSLAQPGVVYIDPFNYPNDPVPFRLELMKEQENKQYQSVWGPTLVNPGQRYTTTSLEPGFYVAVANSTGPKDFFGLSLWNPTLFGGVSGGWLDSQTGVGFAAFDITKPRTVNFNLWFGQIYGDLGVERLNLEIYYQKADGTRELYWSVPNKPEKVTEEYGEFVESIIPPVLSESSELPPDPGDAGKTSLEGIDSDKDGVRDDVQRYIALTYPAPEDKPLRATLRQYSAVQQQFLKDANDKWKTVSNAEIRNELIDCVLYFRPEDGLAILVNFRAEYLNTVERSRAYLKADSQLGGQVFSLTPADKLPLMCSKFDSLRTREAEKIGENQCDKKGIVIAYANGMLTEQESAEVELRALSNILEKAKSDSQIKDEKVNYALAYNQNEKNFTQLFELGLQKLAEEATNAPSTVWRWLGNTEEAPQFFKDAVLKSVDKISLVIDEDLQHHVTMYKNAIDEGKKVVVVAYSQGNFYANRAYGNLDDPDHLRTKSFGIVSVGTPTDFVAGGGPYTTINIDVLMNIIRGVFPNTLPANVTNSFFDNTLPIYLKGMSDKNWALLSGHMFTGNYLAGNISGPKIINDVIKLIEGLVTSEIANQGLLTVRLDWSAQPDVDLHVYEPSGAHVYYQSKQGISGYLDVDDTTSYGPEHYYGSCDKLEEGIYKVGVNYFRGDGPETARIQIIAGDLSPRDFSIPLAGEKGPGGDGSPIPVAAIKVFKDETGAFKFAISQGNYSQSNDTEQSGDTQQTLEPTPEPTPEPILEPTDTGTNSRTDTGTNSRIDAGTNSETRTSN